ncbi:MAG: M4 family metallopeptidase [Candidatus Zixiibacteriota bacterium]|nr:MAG: M4 family metallopeptidase [candidate division Zixibacteria bacterium]
MRRLILISSQVLFMLICGIVDDVNCRTAFARSFEDERAITAALDHLETHKGDYGMESPSNEMEVKRVDTDAIGMRHVRFDQYYAGVRVFGGEMIVHSDRSGRAENTTGKYYKNIGVEVDPRVTPEEALDAAVKYLSDKCNFRQSTDAELVIFPWEGTYYLCWRLGVKCLNSGDYWDSFVDALDGEVVHVINRLMTDDVIGTGYGVMGDYRNHIDAFYNGIDYELRDRTRRIDNDPHGHDGEMLATSHILTHYTESIYEVGTVATDANNVWDQTDVQSPAVDAHFYLGLVYDWMLSEFDRNSYDDNGSSIIVSVNAQDVADNAFWFWEEERMVFCRWSAGRRSLAGCPDVVAHEFAHGVTVATSDLIYEKEPGALHESFSDMMGTAFEWAHPEYDTPDWLCGENGYTSGTGAFRSLSDPHIYGHPDYYGDSDPYWHDTRGCGYGSSSDAYGVHTNSGVGNKWFYLVSEGGYHHGVSVTGIGIENAALLAYWSNAYYWTSAMNYYQAALATISAALALEPAGATWHITAEDAWKAVGVLSDYDQDGLADAADNCPQISNSDQADIDNDEIGDACDNCLNTYNPCQRNYDEDSYGDLCDNCTDYDDDGYGDPNFPNNTCPEDNCPGIYNPDQADSDGDGVGDACVFVCGDANFDGTVSLGDANYLINYIFKDGPPPMPHLLAGDADCGGSINVGDPVYIINYVYRNGPEPCANCP